MTIHRFTCQWTNHNRAFHSTKRIKTFKHWKLLKSIFFILTEILESEDNSEWCAQILENLFGKSLHAQLSISFCNKTVCGISENFVRNVLPEFQLSALVRFYQE